MIGSCKSIFIGFTLTIIEIALAMFVINHIIMPFDGTYFVSIIGLPLFALMFWAAWKRTDIRLGNYPAGVKWFWSEKRKMAYCSARIATIQLSNDNIAYRRMGKLDCLYTGPAPLDTI